MKASELAKKLLLNPDNEVKLYFNVRNNKTDEVELYETQNICIGYLGDNNTIIRMEIII